MLNKIFFTPGPSQLFYSFNDHFKKAIREDIASISHRSAQFVKVVEETNEALCTLFNLPSDYMISYLSSANEVWDRIIQNLVIHSSHHFVNGAFSKKFFDFSQNYAMQSTLTRADDGATFDTFSIPDNAELIAITKNETSIGYAFQESEIEEIRNRHADKLIALDVVSASPCLPVNFQAVDTAYFSVQKAFGMPAGLGIWIANERCIEKANEKAKQTSIGSYRTLPNLKKFNLKHQTPETPNMLYIYILGKITQDMIAYGIQRIQSDTLYKATLLHKTIEEHPSLDYFVSSKSHRSHSTIVSKAKNASLMISTLKKKGIVIGGGYGTHSEKHIRIANFPAHSRESVEQLCDLMKEVE